jgi:hypothetical protein
VANTDCQLILQKNTNPFAANNARATGGDQTMQIVSDINCAVGDFVQANFFHADAAARNITGDTNLTFFTVSQA